MAWKTLNEDTDYEINELGQIKNKHGRILSGSNNHGYRFIKLRGKAHYVHRLVVSNFIGDIGDKQVNHKDGVKHNNSVENLEIVTSQENVRHAFRTGLHKHRLRKKEKKCEWCGKTFKVKWFNQRFHDNNCRAKYVGSLNSGKKLSLETRERMSASATIRWKKEHEAKS